MQFTRDDLQRFAEWSGDHNPLHVDPAFARSTPFGQPIAHGMLSVVEALWPSLRADEQLTGLEIEFRGAVVPGVHYDVETTRSNDGLNVAVRSNKNAVLNLLATTTSAVGPDVDLSWITSVDRDADHMRHEPVPRGAEELERGVTLAGVYRTGSDAGISYAEGPHRLAAKVLALCSYIVGMELPGLRSLFTRVDVRFASADPGAADDGALLYRARTVRFDRHFRILDTQIDIATSDGRPVAAGVLRSYVPFGPSSVDLDALTAHLLPTTGRLNGLVALVCGGSRGLGADVSAALSLAGCHVYVSARSEDEHLVDLRRRLQERGRDLEFVRGDAANAAWCSGVVEQIRAARGRLDLLVLNACSAPSVLRIGPDALSRHEEYVRDNMRLVQTPLAACLPTLDECAGTVVYVSSSFVSDPPAGLSHYVALKQAAEAVIRTAQHERPRTTAVIARPPRLQTSWNDTPTGAAGAIPTAAAALQIVNQLGERAGTTRVDVIADFPALQPLPVAVAAAKPLLPAFPLRVCASFTIDPLVPGLRFWLAELGLAEEIHLAPYGQVLQTLLDPNSLFAARGGLNVVLLRVRDWLHELSPAKAESIDFVRGYLQEMARDVENALRAHRAHAPAATLLLFCPSYGAASSAESILLRQTEGELIASLEGVPGLYVARAAEYHPHYRVDEDEVGDPVREQLAHIPYRDAYYDTLATIVMRHAYRKLARPRKVIVVDCDNTLWRDAVGEVGAEGVSIEPCHTALHDALSRLARSGILVCLCSKNEESDVWRVFDSRPDLRLSRSDIVAAAINWQPKSANIRALASQLNLALDSVIFIDDNPVECAEVRAQCPEVLTLQWPLEPERAMQMVRHTWELDATKATQEDQRRTQMYREEFRRQELRHGALTFADFIGSLELRVDIAPLVPEDLRRASQLTLRTNQFNFTTRRRDESELQALAVAGTHEIRTVRVKDRFGDYGLVGLIIAEPQESVLFADTFLLSCRVLGRGVEHQMMAEFGRIAAARHLRSVRMRVDTTSRNTPARQFLESVGSPDPRQRDEQVLECDFAADTLTAVRFEPTAQLNYVPSEGEGEGSGQDKAADSSPAPTGYSHLRQREAQVARSAYELSDQIRLAAAIGGVGLTAKPPVAGAGDVGEAVYGAFSAALRVPVSAIKELDRLEALGCDSMKIVEITVALLEKYPWLPSTLLFEHRSVSEIVREITQLSGHASPVVGPVEADLQIRPQGSVEADLQVRPRDIAVVGMHVRCAGASSPDELWNLLSGGRSAVRPVDPHRRHFLQPLSDTRPHWAGLLDDVGRFDAEFFGISPREAEAMDPQLRLFLEVAWSALEDAGCAGHHHDPRTGVFVGVMYGDYAYRANIGAASTGSPYRSWEGFSLANRLSQVLGFGGPSLAVDTACSSSGTALHLASQALNAGDCRVAIVGGVNLILDPDRFGSLGRLGILSPRGMCEPFGADADGTVLGEGAGVVVLRPLADALARGDRIYGVIKGTGLSTGSGTVGFTAPNPQAQADAIERSVRSARVDPRTIMYVETHGTGTVLGDPIEVRGLTLAYSKPELHDPATPLDLRCRIGSIKPNIGHLEAGAGILGLIKVLLQLDRGMLLPSMTSEQPNPHIRFAPGSGIGDPGSGRRDSGSAEPSVPFKVQKTLEPWDRHVVTVDGTSVVVPRRAGLSSFGVGGANAHVIVEEAPADRVDGRPVMDRPAHLLTLSARSEESLERQVSALRRYLDDHADVSLADVCFSSGVGRKHFEHRLAIPATSREQLAESLDTMANGAEPVGLQRGLARADTRPRIAFLFTGQGSQYAGMGRALYEAAPVFREALDRCATIFDRLLGQPLLDLLFAKEGSPEAALLNQTGFTQPALFAFEYALAELWRSWGVTPDIVMGHSVGELAAICVAGGVSLDDGLKLIAARGRLMQALPPGGTMTSVMAAEGRVLEAISGREDLVAIAAINAPGQVVISGAGVAVAEITARLEADGIKTKALTVSHAFHSPLMRPMVAEYEAVVREIAFRPPRVPFVSCVDGVLSSVEVTRPEYWVRNVTDPVRFTTGMQVLEAEGVDVFVEIGPQPVLLGMGRQCVVSRDAEYTWLPSLRKDIDPWQTMLAAVGRLHTSGVPIDWAGFESPYPRRTVSLPSYSFNLKQYWLRPEVLNAQERADESVATVTAAAGAPAIYELAWREQSLPPALQAIAQSDAGPRQWVIFADQAGLGARFAEALALSGMPSTVVVPGETFEKTWDDHLVVNPRRPQDFHSLWDAVSAANQAPSIAFLWGLDPTPPASSTHVLSVLNLVQAVAKGRHAGSRLWLVTQSAVDVESNASAVDATQAMLWGFGRTIALEHPDLWGGLVDVSGADDASALARELTEGDADDQVALRGDHRYVGRLEHRALSGGPRVALDTTGTYLVTGGLGALGLRVAEWMVARGARHLVLMTRHGTVNVAAEATLNAIRNSGAEVLVATADITRAEDVDRVLSKIASGTAPLRGVVHAAGIDTSVPLRTMTEEDLQTVLDPKVSGAWLLHERTRVLNLDLLLYFSSMASVLGAQRRAHYGAANAFLDALAIEQRRGGSAALAVNWGPWRGGGMASAEQLEQFERIGNYGLEPEMAVEMLDRLLLAGLGQVVVADVDWPVFRMAYEAQRVRPLVSGLSESRLAESGTSTHKQTARANDQGLRTSRQPDASSAPWIARLQAIPACDRQDALEALLREEAAATLGFERAGDVPLERQFSTLGMDSLMMAEFIGRLGKRVGTSCTALVFDHPSVHALVGPLLDALGPSLEEASPSIEVSASGPMSLAAASGGRVDVDAVRPSMSRIDQGAIEGYSPDSEAEALAFQAHAWPHRVEKLIAPRWRWMFVESARRLGIEPRVWLARDGGRVVGHMGAIPVRLKLGEDERQTAWLVDTMVLESHRASAVGSRLMVQAREDMPFALSLGQTAEMRAILLRLGWQQVAPLRTAQLLLRPENVLKGKLPSPVAWAAGLGVKASQAVRDAMRDRGRIDVTEIARFSDEHDALWNRVAREIRCAVVRDASYLNWKYVDQPGQQFIRLELRDGATLAGSAVLMLRQPDRDYQYRRAFLVDLVAPLSDGACVEQLIRAVAGTAEHRGADALICMHINTPLTEALRACGFMLREPTRFLVVSPGDVGEPLLSQLVSPDGWLVTQGDSDIDRPW